jgi:two-component system, CAI-1 autoinducer sensor kinase/phosphatase CqsS
MAETTPGLRQLLREAIAYLQEAAKRSAEYSERHLRFFGILGLFVLAAYAVDLLVGRPYFDTLWIRIAAFSLLVPFVYARATIRALPAFHFYFVGTASYVLPFTYGLMLVLNAASAPEGHEIEMLWILQYFVSLFLFIQLMHNGLLATVLWITSTVIAMGSLLFLDQINWIELKRVMLYPITGYLTAFFFGIVTNRNVDYVNSEKLKAASAIGANLAHELRTPLASIGSLARSVNKHSQVLLDTYEAAKQAGIHTGEVTPSQVSGLKNALTSIQEEVSYSNTVIDMLLLNTREQSPSSVSDIVPIMLCVQEAVDRYPFNNSMEKDLIRVHRFSDFSIRASRLLIVHVLFNLLKNSIYYAQRAPKGTVKIIVGRNRQPILEITDTGPGIAMGVRRHIFDRFFTTASNGQGAGIGLSFCKMVMESIGGDIQCESREGEYTTFRLIFPPVSQVEPLN